MLRFDKNSHSTLPRRSPRKICQVSDSHRLFFLKQICSSTRKNKNCLHALIWRENLPMKCPRHRHFSERGSQKPPLKHKLSSQASAALMGMKLTGAEGLEAAESDLVRLPAILVPPLPPAAELKFRSMGRLASFVNWRTWNNEKMSN